MNSLVSTRPRCNETLPPSTRSFCLTCVEFKRITASYLKWREGIVPAIQVLSYGYPIMDPYYNATRPETKRKDKKQTIENNNEEQRRETGEDDAT